MIDTKKMQVFLEKFRRKGFFIKLPAEMTEEDNRFIKRFHEEQRCFRNLWEKRYGMVRV